MKPLHLDVRDGRILGLARPGLAHPEEAAGRLEGSALPQGPFALILADPPWAFRTFNSAGRTPTQKKFNRARPAEVGTGSAPGTGGFNQPEDHYPTMPLAELKALPVGEIAAKDAALAMWLVGSHCDVALDLARAWGFSFTTDLFYWLKQKRIRPDQLDLFTGDVAPLPMSMGYYTRKQVEPCWLFTRGKGLAVLDHGVRQLIVAPKSTHSRKPAEQYERIDRLFGTDLARIELFSRATRQGWTAWGNETGKFDGEGG